MIKCPNCLHGWRRDVMTFVDEEGNERTEDVECNTCSGTGFVSEVLV